MSSEPPQEAEIVALSHDGRGIARIGGKAVFVAGALVGERVTLRRTGRRRKLDEAVLVEILVRSPDRIEPRCEHFGLCGGCSLQHLSAPAQLQAKQSQLLEDLQRIGKVSPERVLAPLTGPSWGYRRRARLGVKFVHKKGRVLAGFREREKPYLADIRHCEVLAGDLRSLPERLAALAEKLSIREQLPQVEVAVADNAVALVFRVMSAPTAADLELLDAFGRDHEVQVFLQSGGLDTVRPLRPDYPSLAYTIDEPPLTLTFAPTDFVQINRAINHAMVAAALAALAPRPEDSVLDLFCGLGNFTLPLARRAKGVVGVEGDAGLVAKAHANAAANGCANAVFFAENLFEPATFGAWAAARYDLVLLDPPRAGARELLPKFDHWSPRRVVYISCHPGTLARDAGILVENHGFRLVGAGVMDMFPQTTHVESIAVFEAKI